MSKKANGFYLNGVFVPRDSDQTHILEGLSSTTTFSREDTLFGKVLSGRKKEADSMETAAAKRKKDFMKNNFQKVKLDSFSFKSNTNTHGSLKVNGRELTQKELKIFKRLAIFFAAIFIGLPILIEILGAVASLLAHGAGTALKEFITLLMQ